jgi:hypothetical protein
MDNNDGSKGHEFLFILMVAQTLCRPLTAALFTATGFNSMSSGRDLPIQQYKTEAVPSVDVTIKLSAMSLTVSNVYSVLST